MDINDRLNLQLPDEARAMAMQQLETLTGAAKGLTRTNDSLLIFDDSPEVQNEAQQMHSARNDPRMSKLRDDILNALRAVVNLWCTDAMISDVSIDSLTSVLSALTAVGDRSRH